MDLSFSAEVPDSSLVSNLDHPAELDRCLDLAIVGGKPHLGQSWSKSLGTCAVEKTHVTRCVTQLLEFCIEHIIEPVPSGVALETISSIRPYYLAMFSTHSTRLKPVIMASLSTFTTSLGAEDASFDTSTNPQP